MLLLSLYILRIFPKVFQDSAKSYKVQISFKNLVLIYGIKLIVNNCDGCSRNMQEVEWEDTSVLVERNNLVFENIFVMYRNVIYIIKFCIFQDFKVATEKSSKSNEKRFVTLLFYRVHRQLYSKKSIRTKNNTVIEVSLRSKLFLQERVKKGENKKRKMCHCNEKRLS